jgi:hypothetical protein
MSDDHDIMPADELAERIVKIINDQPYLSDGTRFMACMMVIGDGLASIECPACREIAFKSLSETFPQILATAMAHAATAAHPSHHTH